MIKGFIKSVPNVLIVCPFVEKYSKQLVDFKDCVFYVCIFFYLAKLNCLLDILHVQILIMFRSRTPSLIVFY